MKLSMLIIFYIVSILILSGCGGITPTPQSGLKIDKKLQVIELTKKGVAIDSNVVAFEWKAILDPMVKGIFVYKKSNLNNNITDNYYATINNRFVTHFVDDKIKPNTKYSYFFKTYGKNSVSLKSKTKVVKSLPVLESVSWIYAVQNMPRSAKIIWRPHTNQKVKSYIIERKIKDEKEWKNIARVDKRFSAEYIDKELDDKTIYKYRVCVLTYDNIISSPSKEVKIVTKALPKKVNNILASVDIPKAIKITWDKTTVKDFKIYHLYRAESKNGSYELIATLHNNHFIDKIDEDGKIFFYRVSVIDLDDLESEHRLNTIHGITLTKPKPPVSVKLNIVDNEVEISWKNIDSRVKSYIISKKYRAGWFKDVSESIDNIKTGKFIDTKIDSDIIYHYRIIGIDSNGIKSNPSDEVVYKSKKKDDLSTKKEVKKVKVKAVSNDMVETLDTVIPTQDFN